jgi:hypothetical protein
MTIYPHSFTVYSVCVLSAQIMPFVKYIGYLSCNKVKVKLIAWLEMKI